MPNAPEIWTIVQHVCHHLRVHPQASDTPEGIAHWWVDADLPVPMAAVEAALERLVRAGVVEPQPVAADGRVRYRRTAAASDARLQAIELDPQRELGPASGPVAGIPGPRGPKWH